MMKRHVLAAGAGLVGMLLALVGACGGSSGGNTGGSGGLGGGGDGCGGDGCHYCDDLMMQSCPSALPAPYAACDAPPQPCLAPNCNADVAAACGTTSIDFICDETGWQLWVDPTCAALCSQHAAQAECAGDGACRWLSGQGDLATGCYPLTTCSGEYDCPAGGACEQHTVDGVLQGVCVP